METFYWWHFLTMDSDKKEINLFIEQANFYPTIKFTAEISDN